MASTIYEEFLELAAIDGEERQCLLPQWIEATKRMKLTEEDVRIATREWIPTHLETNYLGCRKVLGALVREAVDHSKLADYRAQGKKLVYGVLPAILTPYLGLKKAGGDNIFVSFPDLNMMVMAQYLFNRGGQYFELAEQYGMTYGARHCALNKMRIGVTLTGMVPPPDVDWAWGLVCDEATKAAEYINCMYHDQWRTVITRLPHDTAASEHQWEMPERVKYLAQELRYSVGEVEKITGIKMRDEHLAEAYAETQQLIGLLGALMVTAATADPQPLRGTTFLISGQCMGYPLNTGMDYYKDGLQTLLAEVQRDVKNGVGEYPKGAPKVGFYFIPWSLPWVDKMFMDNGVATGLSLSIMPAKRQMEPSKYSDPYEMLAEQWLKRIYGMGCKPEIDDWIEKVSLFKPDAMIMGFLDYDRWIGQLHKVMARKVEEATGVPSFYMEADFYDGRDYSPEALRTRIESICQIVKVRKSAK